MAPVWKADSEAVLEALRISPLRKTRPLEFNVLFGYILSSREGIDNWHVISAGLRRSLGRSIAPVRAGSWSRHGAEHLAQLLWLQSHPNDWIHWWNKTALSKTKINPGWPSFAPPPTDN